MLKEFVLCKLSQLSLLLELSDDIIENGGGGAGVKAVTRLVSVVLSRAILVSPTAKPVKRPPMPEQLPLVVRVPCRTLLFEIELVQKFLPLVLLQMLFASSSPLSFLFLLL